MRRPTLAIVVAAVVVVAIVLILVFRSTRPTAPAEILVGVPAPLTGIYAGFGEGFVFGMRAAVDDVNRQGGVQVKQYGARIPMRLIVVNTESDPTKAGALAEDLVARSKVHFLAAGDQPPPMHPGVATVADRYAIPYVMSTGPLEPSTAMRNEVQSRWKYTWATGLFAIVTPAPAGDFRAGPGYTIVDTWKAMLDLYGDQTNKKVAVFASDDPDGVGWFALFSKTLQEWGYTVIGTERKLGLTPMDTADFSSIIRRWKDEQAEILWGNAPAPFVGTLLRQAAALGFKPKMVSIGRAPLFYEDVSAWGGDLPLGIGVEIWWDPSFQNSPGIGGTTPQSLAQRWAKDTGRQLNRNIGPGYRIIQVLIDAIERAGVLDGPAVNAALAKTDLLTIGHRVKFDENQFSRGPLVFGQWVKTDKPWVWELPVVFSKHDFIKATANPIFPIPSR